MSSLGDRGQREALSGAPTLVKLQEGEHREVGGWACHLLRGRWRCHAAWRRRCCVKSARTPQFCNGCWWPTGESKLSQRGKAC